jgi:biopolymer transport protein ExbD
VDRTGQIFFERNPMTASQLRATLIQWRQREPNAAVVVRADRDLRYQQLVDVFDALKQAGIAKMGLVNNPNTK